MSTVKLADVAWGMVHAYLMQSIKASLRSAVTLAYINSAKSVCAFTDESERQWAAVVTECDKFELRKPIGEKITRSWHS